MLMELAFLLRGVGSEVVWITNQKPAEPDDVTYSLEHKMLDHGVQVHFNFMLLLGSLFFSQFQFFSLLIRLGLCKSIRGIFDMLGV